MGQTRKTKVLVTGVGGPAGINISRLLAQRDDVEVTGCDVDASASGQFFVDHFVIAPYVKDADAYKEWMIKTVNDQNFDIVIPTVDDELPLLGTFVDQLNAFVPLSPLPTLTASADKLQTYDLVRQHLPGNSVASISLQDWTPQWKEDVEFFLKPRSGRGGRGCKVVKREELEWLKINEPNLAEWVVMEHLPGIEWTVDAYVGKSGDIAYLTPRERLGLSGGISVKGKTVKHEGVIDATTKLLTKLQCHGPVCIQWKADAAGQPRFVEINPRLSGGLPISVAAGINPLTALFEEFENKSVTPQDWREISVMGYLDYKDLET